MKKVLFLIIYFVAGGVYSQTQYDYTPYVLGLDIGRQVFPISVTGSFLPAGLIPYPNFPPLNNEPGPATAIDVSNLPAGTLIRVKRLGAAQFLPSWLDETIYTMAVFVNADLKSIAAGGKTNAWSFGPVHFCPLIPGTGVVDFPYDMNISGVGIINEKSYILEVPVGAAKLLVAPADCPSQDNTDPNGDYKLEVSYPIVEKMDIYQVVKNPILFAPSTTIDLVAGKNADIVVRTTPDVNVEGSYIEWKSTDGLLTKTFNLKPGQTTSTASGDVTFYIDPVPKEASFINGETQPRVFLKGKNISGITVDLDTSELDQLVTKIHKTKPMRIGFVPVSGCTDEKQFVLSTCFSAPLSADITNLAKHGGDITKAMYPVADDDFSVTVITDLKSGLYVPKYEASVDSEFAADAAQLNKKWEFEYSKSMDLVVGVISESYRNKRILRYIRGNSQSVKEAGTVGVVAKIPSLKEAILDPSINRAQLVTTGYYHTVAHEIGHSMSLTHQCQGIPLGSSRCTEEKNTFDGYNSTALSSDWSLPRGLVGDRISMMRDKSQFLGFVNPEISTNSPWEKNKWIAYDEYRNLFLANLNYSRSRVDRFVRTNQEALSVYIEISEKGYAVNNFYFKPAGSILTINPQAGKYQIDILDLNQNLIYTNYTNELNASETDNKILTFDIPVGKNAMFIKIYKIVSETKTLVKFLSIPAEILQEEVKFFDGNAFSGSLNQFRNNITSEIKKLDEKLKCQSYNSAKVHISSKILNLVNQNMRDVAQISGLNIDAKKFRNIVVTSLSRTMTPILGGSSYINPFIETCLEKVSTNSMTKSKLTLELVRQPESKEYSYVAEAQIDHQLVEIKSQGAKFIAESGAIGRGSHVWEVSVHMVNKKIYQQILNSISQMKKNISVLSDQLAKEADLITRAELQNKIDIQTRQLNGLMMEKKKEENKMGNPQILNFEVL